MLGYLIAGGVSIGALYLGYRYATKNKLIPAGGGGQGGSVAPAGRQVGTQALPAGNDRTTMANNAISTAAGLAPAVVQTINPNFKPTGTSPSNPGATGSQVSGNNVEQTGILAGAQVAGALAPAGISALQKALTTSPTPTAVVDPLSSNTGLSQQSYVGSTPQELANIEASGDNFLDSNYYQNEYSAPSGENFLDSNYYNNEYGELTTVDSGFQSDYTPEPDYGTLDPTFSGDSSLYDNYGF